MTENTYTIFVVKLLPAFLCSKVGKNLDNENNFLPVKLFQLLLKISFRTMWRSWQTFVSPIK